MKYLRLSEPLQKGCLFLSSVIPTVPASLLTWAETLFYERYVQAPRIWGVSAIQDVQSAGLATELRGGLLLCSVIT